MSFVRNAWYLAVWSSELGETPIRRTICGEEVALYRAEDGRALAIGAVCPHRGADLAAGTTMGGTLRCPFHGWRFDAGGACVEIPSQPTTVSVPASACVAAYPLCEQQGAIWIWPGHDGEPTEAAPRFPILDETETLLTNPADVLDAEFVNVIENAFDESHLYYLHPRTIGVATPLVPRQLVTISEDRRQVTCRWDPDSPWGHELFYGYDEPGNVLERIMQRRFGLTRHDLRRWHFRMGGVVWYHEPLDSGRVVGVIGAATPLDERRTWFATGLVHPLVGTRFPNGAIRLWGRRLNREDRIGTVGLLRTASQLGQPVSALADRGPNQFRRIHQEWLELEADPAPEQRRQRGQRRG